jgi:hypothetical protein
MYKFQVRSELPSTPRALLRHILPKSAFFDAVCLFAGYNLQHMSKSFMYFSFA